MSTMVRTARAFVFALTALALAGPACDGGREGDRCNPSLSHDDCGDGLTCMAPATCVETYCCPALASASSNPYCNGMACPVAPPVPEASSLDDANGTDATSGVMDATPTGATGTDAPNGD